MKEENAAARAAKVLYARQMTGGPRLYAALKPVADKVRGTHLGDPDRIALWLTREEVAAVIAAIDGIDRYDELFAEYVQDPTKSPP